MLRDTLQAVGGDAIAIGNVIVCGSKGVPPLSGNVSPEQKAEVDREQSALEHALAQACELRSSMRQPVYLLWHYPPFDAFGRAAPWVSSIEEAGVTACVYGHLHTEGQWSRATQGNIRGVRYYCVAADALGFRPLRIDSC
jgi:predicted phosphohydrolase